MHFSDLGCDGVLKAQEWKHWLSPGDLNRAQVERKIREIQQQLWLADDVFGKIITTTNRGQLVSWDQQNSLLQIVDPRKGGVVSSLSIPNTKNLITDSKTNGSLYILKNDDVLIRLVPRN